MGSVGERGAGGTRVLSRRQFLKWASAAAVASVLPGMSLLSALGVVRGPREPVPEWEAAPGVVDYHLVPETVSGPTPNVLRVAQWYDYWPGSFLAAFKQLMKDQHGVDVNVQWDVYTSNDELFYLLTVGRRRYDVIFPTNNLVETLKKANMIYTLNEDWLPNHRLMDPDLVGVPAGDPYDRRGSDGPLVAMPYFWGTTGLGFRTDRIPKADVEALGYDFFWMDSYRPHDRPEVDLRKKMRMTDEMGDVMATGLKKAGWEWQRDKGLTPSGLVPPQWTLNEVDPGRIKEAGSWLFEAKPRLFDFSSTDQASSLVIGSATLNLGWSGDMMYGIRPDQNTRNPIDYVIPPQGTSWWLDCACIDSRSRNLWLAHQFINFTQDVKQHRTLTYWNLYSSPNRSALETLKPFSNGYDMRDDPRLYPNILAPEHFRLCELARDVGLDALLNLYYPLWFDLTAE